MLEVISLEAGVPVTPAETSPLTQLKRSPMEDETLSSTYTVGKATTELEVIILVAGVLVTPAVTSPSTQPKWKSYGG